MIHTPISYQPLITNSSIHFDLGRLISATTVALLDFNDRTPGVTCPYPCFLRSYCLFGPSTTTLKVVHYSPNLHLPEAVNLDFTEGDEIHSI